MVLSWKRGKHDEQLTPTVDTGVMVRPRRTNTVENNFLPAVDNQENIHGLVFLAVEVNLCIFSWLEQLHLSAIDTANDSRKTCNLNCAS